MPDNRSLFDAVAAWAAESYPGFPVEMVTIQLRYLPIPVQLPVASAPVIPLAKQQPAAPDAWEPSEYQAAILQALDFRALRSDALVTELDRMGENGDRTRLWKARGIKELVDRGLVKNDRRVGYYRPDAPPEELVDA